MPKRMYAVIGGRAKKIKKQYVVINGVAKKVKKMYAVVNGVTKQIFGGVDAGEVVFTASTEWTVPEGVTSIDIFCVGGGGGAGGSSFYSYMAENNTGYWPYTYDKHGSAGAGGYTKSIFNKPVNSGDTLTIAIGSGGESGLYYDLSFGKNIGTASNSSMVSNGSPGGSSSVIYKETLLLSSDGGKGGYKNTNQYYISGVSGGSGSSVGGSYLTSSTNMNYEQQYTAIKPGQNGADGYKCQKITTSNTGTTSQTDFSYGTPGKGQGTSTKYFGEDNGTLYSTAGEVVNGSPTVANSGNGGSIPKFNGASGIVIIRWSAQD